ncbi:MAG TPA: hypothetical protein VFN35_29540 [Ktedonobacteraceae bacterium]|nr:hypothetical protein [Ktedonobacteraceae bacterium]
MRLLQLSKMATGGLIFLLGALFLLVGCGSNSTNGTISSTATACVQVTRTGTPPASTFANALGTLKSISGQTLVLTTRQGTEATIAYTNSTRFTQESTIALTDLQKGTDVRVGVVSSGGTYSATTVTVTNGTNGTNGNNGGGNGNNGGRFPGGNGTPGVRGRGGNGTPGTRNNPCFARGRFATPATANNNFRGVVGTVTHVGSQSLAITDNAGQTYTVTITAQTQIIETKSVTAAALKVGQPLQVNGTNKQSVITANTITILLSLPERPATPTP